MGEIRRLGELLADWRHLVRRDGWRAALPTVGRAVVTLPYRRLEFLIVARSLTDPLPTFEPKIRLHIRPFEIADLDFVKREHLPSEAHLCARRLALEHYGLVACHNDRVVGYTWGGTDTSLERVSLELRPGDVLCTDSFTAPSARGRRVQTALVLARMVAFREQGYTRAIAYIEVSNAPSLAAWRKVGAKTVGRMTFIRIGPWRMTRYDGDIAVERVE